MTAIIEKSYKTMKFVKFDAVFMLRFVKDIKYW